MKKTRMSSSAQSIATIRAIESQKPDGRRICYDPFARKLISPGYLLVESAFNYYAERRSPGLFGYIACRTRYIDDYLDSCLQNDTKQVVILGAGLDARAYRFPAFKYIYLSAYSAEHPRAEIVISRWTHRYTGEPLTFGIEKGQIVDFMTRRGFTGVVDACAEDFARLYCTGSNQGRPVADTYGIVHAAVPLS